MPDHTGTVRRLSDFKGKAVVLFFGYTQCPDVCPTTLPEVAAALAQLGPKAKDVRVLFVTVDPERDSPEVLAQYVPAFDPGFLALRGSVTELDTRPDNSMCSSKRVRARVVATRWTTRQAATSSTRRCA